MQQMFKTREYMLHAAVHRMEESLKTVVWDYGVLDIRGSVHKTKGE